MAQGKECFQKQGLDTHWFALGGGQLSSSFLLFPYFNYNEATLGSSLLQANLSRFVFAITKLFPKVNNSK